MARIPRQKTLFLVRASWRATAKTLRVMAYSEDDAVARATRMKENAGCLDFTIIKETDGTDNCHTRED